MAAHSLDNPIWNSLISAHSKVARRNGMAARFAPDVSPFAALEQPDTAAFSDLRSLVSVGEHVALFTAGAVDVPANWNVARERLIEQMVFTGTSGFSDLEYVGLDEADAPDMMSLAAETEPGPFLPNTISMGRYIGVRAADGRLVAMAGQRLALTGFTEISAVCTSPDYRGQGLSKGLVTALVSQILADGKTPFLHVKNENGAKAVYEKVGFTVRCAVQLTVISPAS